MDDSHDFDRRCKHACCWLVSRGIELADRGKHPRHSSPNQRDATSQELITHLWLAPLYPGWLTSVLDYSSGTTFDRDTSRGGMATFIFWCTSAVPCATSSLTTSPRSKWKTTVAAFDLPAKVSIWIRGERRQDRICIILHRETRIPCNGSIGNRHAI